MSHRWNNRRVLVTGGTGFIGSRLVERLLQVTQNAVKVRVLVHKLPRAVRVARFPVEMVPGDLTLPGSIRDAVSGCDLIFHCAYGQQRETSRAVNVEGTVRLLEAAREAEVQRLVYLSSIMVYGPHPEGDLDESLPYGTWRLPYGETKREAEERVLEAGRRGLPVVVLQPTAVYGPWSPGWTVDVLHRMHTGRILLVNEGRGTCNAVYVDDLISAMLLAGQHPDAPGERFIISSEEAVTWREFYGRYEQMVGRPATQSLSQADALAFCRARQRRPHLWQNALQLLRRREVRESLEETVEFQFLRRLVSKLPSRVQGRLKASWSIAPSAEAPASAASVEGEGRLHAILPELVPFFAAKTRARIDKARTRLGYHPAFTLAEGMALTEQWARWAKLLPDRKSDADQQGTASTLALLDGAPA